MGIWLLLPFDSFLPQLQSNVFPEWLQAIAILTVGALILYGVIKSKLSVLRAGAGLGFYVWLLISIAFASLHFLGIGWIMFATLATYYGYIYLNIKINNDFYLNVTSYGDKGDRRKAG